MESSLTQLNEYTNSNVSHMAARSSSSITHFVHTLVPFLGLGILVPGFSSPVSGRGSLIEQYC